MLPSRDPKLVFCCNNTMFFSTTVYRPIEIFTETLGKREQMENPEVEQSQRSIQSCFVACS